MSVEISERTDFDHRRDIDGYKGYDILRKCGNEVCDYNIYDINEYSFSILWICDDPSKVIYEFLCQSMTRFDLQYPLVTRCSALCALCVLSVCALSAVCSVCSVCFVCGGDDCWDRLHNIYADSDKKFKLLGELLGELLRKKSRVRSLSLCCCVVLCSDTSEIVLMLYVHT